MYGNPDKKYWVDDTLNPDEYDEDELAEEKAKRGQFSVIFKLFEYLPEAKEAKAHLDRIIDLCGERPIGTNDSRPIGLPSFVTAMLRSKQAIHPACYSILKIST